MMIDANKILVYLDVVKHMRKAAVFKFKDNSMSASVFSSGVCMFSCNIPMELDEEMEICITITEFIKALKALKSKEVTLKKIENRLEMFTDKKKYALILLEEESGDFFEKTLTIPLHKIIIDCSSFLELLDDVGKYDGSLRFYTKENNLVGEFGDSHSTNYSFILKTHTDTLVDGRYASSYLQLIKPLLTKLKEEEITLELNHEVPIVVKTKHSKFMLAPRVDSD